MQQSAGVEDYVGAATVGIVDVKPWFVTASLSVFTVLPEFRTFAERSDIVGACGKRHVDIESPPHLQVGAPDACACVRFHTADGVKAWKVVGLLISTDANECGNPMVKKVDMKTGTNLIAKATIDTDEQITGFRVCQAAFSANSILEPTFVVTESWVMLLPTYLEHIPRTYGFGKAVVYSFVGHAMLRIN